MKKIAAVDMDGVLCENGGYTEEDFYNRKPLIENIKKINKLYNTNHYIIIFTARRLEVKAITEYWLQKYEVKYDVLVMDKLRFDFYVDEKRKLKAIEEVK